MLTSRQRSNLRSKSNNLQSILHVGKGGLEEQVIKQAYDALKARELIKLTVLETCDMSSREISAELAEAVNADVVQVIGRKAVLFKRNPDNPKYDDCLK